MRREATDYLLSYAEKALKRLRENPNDKKPVEELERAMNKLKELQKPKPPTGQPR
jgi:hypothetical protein